MSRLGIFAVASLVVGVLALVVLELTAIGVVLLFAFIVAGVFAIADPEILGREDAD